MKVTKFVHSCLLVETSKLKVLIDPGRHTWNSRLLNVGNLPRLDYIIFTHDHGDHYFLPALQALSKRFPHTPITTTNDLAEKLSKEGLSNPIGAGSENGLHVYVADHEVLPWGIKAPLNIGVHIDDKLTHPGDSLKAGKVRDVLALPLTAPWGSVKQALDYAIMLKPKVVLPIHDWHWHKVAREEMYAQSKKRLATKGIEFIELENGVPVEL